MSKNVIANKDFIKRWLNSHLFWDMNVRQIVVFEYQALHQNHVSSLGCQMFISI